MLLITPDENIYGTHTKRVNILYSLYFIVPKMFHFDILEVLVAYEHI